MLHAHSQPPPVTVVVPTRNRPARAAATVRQLLDCDGDFEVVVVDQSDDGATRLALAELEGATVRLVSTATRGVAAARNLGVAHARGALVGLLDDDCEAPLDWVPQLVAAFGTDDRVGVVFGNLQAGPHDPAAGFVGSYLRDEPCLVRHLWEQDRADGVAACMGIRREVWEQLDGFDEMLGVGAPLKAAAEGDFTLRALAAGHFVYDTPRWMAVHRGFRGWEESPDTVHRYWYGTGAMLAKPLKLGERGAWRLLTRLGWRWAFGRSPVSVGLGTSAHRLSRLSAFLRGFATGVLTPLDRSTGHYRGAAVRAGRAHHHVTARASAARRGRA